MASSMLPPRRASRAIGNEIDYNLANLEGLVREGAAKEGDLAFLKLLDDIEEYELIKEAVGDNYYLSINEDMMRGRKNPTPSADYGKIELKSKDPHGLSDSKATINSILMALDSRKHGPVVQREGRSPTKQDLRLRQAVENQLSNKSIMTLAGVGLRNKGSHLDWQDRVDRSADRIIELSYGYNPVTGAPYAGVGLDGGHKLPHDTYPELSDARENMMLENKYENRAKGKRLGEAERQAYINNIISRFVSKHQSDKYQPNVPANVLVDAWQVNAPYEVI